MEDICTHLCAFALLPHSFLSFAYLCLCLCYACMLSTYAFLSLTTSLDSFTVKDLSSLLSFTSNAASCYSLSLYLISPSRAP